MKAYQRIQLRAEHSKISSIIKNYFPQFSLIINDMTVKGTFTFKNLIRNEHLVELLGTRVKTEILYTIHLEFDGTLNGYGYKDYYYQSRYYKGRINNFLKSWVNLTNWASDYLKLFPTEEIIYLKIKLTWKK